MQQVEQSDFAVGERFGLFKVLDKKKKKLFWAKMINIWILKFPYSMLNQKTKFIFPLVCSIIISLEGFTFLC